MKRYYHIARLDYIPVRDVSSVIYSGGKAIVTLRENCDFLPLDVLAYDRALEVSDEVDTPGRLYAVSFSATLADHFDLSPLKKEPVLMRLTDTLGVERLVGSPYFRTVVTSAYSNTVAAGTLGQVLYFSAQQEHGILPIEYRPYAPAGKFTVAPSYVYLTAGQSRSSVYKIPEELKKKEVTLESTSQYIRAYLRDGRVYIFALRELPANVTLQIPGTDAHAVIRVNGGVGPGETRWDFSSRLPVFGMDNATFDGKIYTV